VVPIIATPIPSVDLAAPVSVDGDAKEVSDGPESLIGMSAHFALATGITATNVTGLDGFSWAPFGNDSISLN